MFQLLDDFPIWAKLIADVVSVEDDQLVSNQFPVWVMVITQTKMRRCRGLDFRRVVIGAAA
jgi:hypothetical protein